MGEKGPARIIVQQRGERIDVQQTSIRFDFPLANGDAHFLCLAPPDTAIGFVILVGDDNFVAGLPGCTDGLCHDIGVHRGRGPYGELVGRNIERLRPAVMSAVHFLPASADGVKRE